MKKISTNQRITKNIYVDKFDNYENSHSGKGESILQLDDTKPLGLGFHVYKVDPGGFSVPHEHTGVEQFILLEGDLSDNDGTEFKPGDFVLFKKGTLKSSQKPVKYLSKRAESLWLWTNHHRNPVG